MTKKSLCLQKKYLVIKQNIIHKYRQIQAVLDEDLKVTLSYLEMEERAAVSALDRVIEKNCSIMQEIEQQKARFPEINRMVNLTAF